AHALQLCSHRLRRLSRIGIALVHRHADGRTRFDGPHGWIDWWNPRATRPKARSVGYDLRMAPAVASSVINPLRSRPFSAALMAETLARPTAAPMVRASAGT